MADESRIDIGAADAISKVTALQLRRNRGVADCTSDNACPSACPETLLPLFSEMAERILVGRYAIKTSEPGVLSGPLFFDPKWKSGFDCYWRSVFPAGAVAKFVGFEARVISPADVTRARHDDEAFAHIQGDCAREHRASRKTRKLPACAIHQAGGIHAQDHFPLVMAVDCWRLRDVHD
jgi:hypothetical protein